MGNLRLALEVFHNVKKPIVHIGLIRELDLDLVQVAERILIASNQHSNESGLLHGNGFEV